MLPAGLLSGFQHLRVCANVLVCMLLGMLIVGNCSKCGKCGSAPTQKSQWGARLAGRTHVHG